MSGLYMEDGSFMSFVREDLVSEIANRQNALSLSSAWFGQLPDPDPILRKMGEDSKILEIFSQTLTVSIKQKK